MQKHAQIVSKILPLLAMQSGEEKLRIAFRLTVFVDTLRAEGKKHEATVKHRTGTTA